MIIKWITVMDGVKFEFNNIISLYKKTILFDDIIVNKVIYILSIYDIIIRYYIMLIIDKPSIRNKNPIFSGIL